MFELFLLRLVLFVEPSKYCSLIVKELAPSFSKLEFTWLFNESVSVKMPTSEVIPIATIRIVRADLSLLFFMERNATRTFTRTIGDILQNLFTGIFPAISLKILTLVKIGNNLLLAYICRRLYF